MISSSSEFGLNEALTETDLVPDEGTAFFQYYGDKDESSRDAETLIREKMAELSLVCQAVRFY